jgi:curved DNA-binding protein CbpA
LGLTQTASGVEVKKAYYAIAKEKHPDKTPNDKRKAYRTEVFKRAQLAYEVLSKPEERRQYDIDMRYM